MAYLPPVKHVLPLTTIRRERMMPVPGVVTVRVNEKVQANHVLAEGEMTPNHYYLDLARGLGVPKNRVSQYMVLQQGDRAEEGDVIAGPVGISRRTVRAPTDGRIVAIIRGRVLFEARGEGFEMRAGMPGKVIATDGASIVTIETTGALIRAAWGNGKRDFGIMRLVGGDPGSRLQTGELDINFRGAILVAGICDHPAPLHQATELNVRGVILGGMSSSLIPAAQRLPYPVVVTEGFGSRPINMLTYELLRSNVGREVALIATPAEPYNTQRPEIIIPLPANRPVGLPDEVIPLKSGNRVRVLREPNQGAVGTVREVFNRETLYPNGVRALSATVELDQGGVLTVPLANLDTLQ
jgi:hypothetical protein